MLRFKQEFKLKNFEFTYRPSRHLFESPWFPTPVIIVYRSVFFLYSSTWIIYRLIAHERFRQVIVPFYLTNWSYFVLIIYFFVSAVVTIFLYVKQRKRQVQDVDTERGHVHAVDGQVRWFQKVQWFFYSVAATMALGVTLFYWVLVFKADMGVSLSDVNVHILNSVFMLIDHSLSSMPVRLFHMVYPMTFTILYMIATLLYWTFITREPIYDAMDYNTNPFQVIGLFLLAILIAAPVVHSFFYATYRLREYVASKRRQDDREEVEHEMEEGKALERE